ncbi:hypothetical protein [Methylopila sp. M107]|uniref:hypothetical protein n=1 Tax=Methylopila sp. M107 TaxID=1101190 RepID=UPI00037E4D7D|nr:hypothetical protein [Methylopila sp. M107]
MNVSERPIYSALKLNSFSDASWAVICGASGAIVIDAEGRLMTRMTKLQASEIAARLSEQSRLDPPPPAS